MAWSGHLPIIAVAGNPPLTSVACRVDRDHVAEVVSGIEDMALEELAGLGATRLRPSEGEVRFSHAEPEAIVAGSRLVSAVYRALEFDVPRPKALLGDAAFRRLASSVTEVAGRGGMGSFRLAAAGVGTPVFRRLAEELERATAVEEDKESGELLMRVRRSASGGWEVLLRLTARPLSTRPWRVCNLPGGANATVAAAIAVLAGGRSFLNLMCGTGTLLVERALAAAGGPFVGVDVSPEAIACARRNVEAAGVSVQALIVDDVTRPGFAVTLPGNVGGATFDVVAADAPWGDAVGSHTANEELYRGLLAAAAAHLAPQGRFMLLTHEVRLAERLVSQAPGWRRLASRRVEHGGHNPLLLTLGRVG